VKYKPYSSYLQTCRVSIPYLLFWHVSWWRIRAAK